MDRRRGSKDKGKGKDEDKDKWQSPIGWINKQRHLPETISIKRNIFNFLPLSLSLSISLGWKGNVMLCI